MTQFFCKANKGYMQCIEINIKDAQRCHGILTKELQAADHWLDSVALEPCSKT